ncbi:MAG: c-type cytochrome [Pontiellaceae bacterium]|nr:c-type cytochrome [Pontiellaceae bacterium]MBN2784952.1 c-type cytochrome [Pontiellaceae bacterium]
MIKDYGIMLLLAFAGFAVLGLSLFKSMDQDFVKYQKQYYAQLGAGDFSVEIRQVNVKTPNGNMIDRCQSCHVGASNPDAVGFEEPLAAHPVIVPGMEKDLHNFAEIGCMVCHDGNGRALKKADAHGEFHDWPAPLLVGKQAQANCNRCHAMEGGSLAGAEEYEKGRDLFLEKACWGCHTIAGISTSSQAPELTDAGGKFNFEYLVESIVEPAANQANTKMPKFDWIHDEATVEALAIYLKGQQKERLRSEESAPIGYVKPVSDVARIESPSVEAGRALFAGVAYEGSIARGGCINCHAFKNGEGDSVGGNVGPELTYTIRARGRQYVRDHIVNSRVHVADSIMPTFKDYNAAELDSLIMFLSTLGFERQASAGQQLFENYCVSCHGEKLDGRGPVSAMLDPLPRDLTRHQFVASYEERFKTSIKDGVKGTAMPPWKDILTDDQIDALLGYIESKSADASDQFVRMQVTLPKPGDVDRFKSRGKDVVVEAGDPARGYDVFQRHCTSCHGKLANGKGPNAYFLVHPLPRNLLNKEFMNQPYVTDQRLYESILLGVAGTGMPHHDDRLSDQSILDIIAFIRANTTEGTE